MGEMAVNPGAIDALNERIGSFGFYLDNNKTASDLPNSYNLGITFTNTGGSTTFPTTYGFVITINANNTRVMQMASKDAHMYVRNSISTTEWGDAWYELVNK